VRAHTPRWEETRAGRTKRFGDTLRHVLPKMPTDLGQIPEYFENVEHLFDIYEVPADLRSKLLIPHLSERAKSLIDRLEVKSLDNYDKMKRFLLGEFKLTAMEYKTRFDKASKRFDETHVLFASSSHDVILAVDVVDELRDMPAVNVMRMPVTVPRDLVCIMSFVII